MGLVEPMVINIKSRKLRETLQILPNLVFPLFPSVVTRFHGLEAMINDNLIKTENDILNHLNCLLNTDHLKMTQY